jgi:hypothetical protein
LQALYIVYIPEIYVSQIDSRNFQETESGETISPEEAAEINREFEEMLQDILAARKLREELAL